MQVSFYVLPKPILHIEVYTIRVCVEYNMYCHRTLSLTRGIVLYSVMQSDRNSSKTYIFHMPITYETKRLDKISTNNNFC